MAVNLLPFHAKPVRLIDGPLVDVGRGEILDRMVADLIEADAFHDERDAVRLLDFKGYGTMRVCMLAGEACYLAKQVMIAKGDVAVMIRTLLALLSPLAGFAWPRRRLPQRPPTPAELWDIHHRPHWD